MKKYGMKLRGCSIGCQPKGFVKFEDTDKKVTGYYSILYYDRKLTKEEIKKYDLEEIKESC